eukprot:GILI01023229.1.p1 GENE.GILI01023229.1~~GILI01023229.1.p1  ORF type:complete len:188 (-),score=49.22 GILI01023229.1:96-659(-)
MSSSTDPYLSLNIDILTTLQKGDIVHAYELFQQLKAMCLKANPPIVAHPSVVAFEEIFNEQMQMRMQRIKERAVVDVEVGSDASDEDEGSEEASSSDDDTNIAHAAHSVARPSSSRAVAQRIATQSSQQRLGTQSAAPSVTPKVSQVPQPAEEDEDDEVERMFAGVQGQVQSQMKDLGMGDGLLKKK